MKTALHRVSKKSVLAILLLGNLALGATTFLQARTIETQRHLIRLMYGDSSELAGFKIAKNVSHANGH